MSASQFVTPVSTFVMLKPDALQRGLVGKIVTRFEEKGLVLARICNKNATVALLRQHYAEHEGKTFFGGLIDSMRDQPVICMVWQGSNDVVAQVRAMVGATNPADRLPGTIRGDFSLERQRNLVHASDSDAAAQREILIWFEEKE